MNIPRLRRFRKNAAAFHIGALTDFADRIASQLLCLLCGQSISECEIDQ